MSRKTAVAGEPEDFDWSYTNLSFLLGLAHCQEHLDDFAHEVNKCKDSLTDTELADLRKQFILQQRKIKYR